MPGSRGGPRRRSAGAAERTRRPRRFELTVEDDAGRLEALRLELDRLARRHGAVLVSFRITRRP